MFFTSSIFISNPSPTVSNLFIAFLLVFWDVDDLPNWHISFLSFLISLVGLLEPAVPITDFTDYIRFRINIWFVRFNLYHLNWIEVRNILSSIEIASSSHAPSFNFFLFFWLNCVLVIFLVVCWIQIYHHFTFRGVTVIFLALAFLFIAFRTINKFVLYLLLL